MDDYGVPQSETLSTHIDFGNFLDDPMFDPFFLSDLSADGSAGEVAIRSSDPVSSWFSDVEHLLMKDDDDRVVAEQPNLESSIDYMSDFLLESPVESDRSGDVSYGKNSPVETDPSGDVSVEKNSPVESDRLGHVFNEKNSPVESDRSSDVSVWKNSNIVFESPVEFESDPAGDVCDGKNSDTSEEDEKEKLGETREEENNGDGDDLNSKKRKRQLRNRDAAVRSRERKKIYVRDLEMKSRYFEAECKRLGMLLQCCFAENQALRISLQNIKAVDATMPKQESAVLLLESLLLGSLLWFLGIVCLFIVPKAHQSTLELVPAESVEHENQGKLSPKKAGSKIFVLPLVKPYIMSKRCKASRSRIKPSFSSVEVLV
ncbi:bZIP transcription factor 60 [Cornus florida]|uniref:bZIP transcription factor 60 n=1 Tax=Cornus florida TaxID=4283 RepID=UPI00289E67EA|nr:bZIP transcription factor 60 [Cornus florida]